VFDVHAPQDRGIIEIGGARTASFVSPPVTAAATAQLPASM
jgi:hypothetical protein